MSRSAATLRRGRYRYRSKTVRGTRRDADGVVRELVAEALAAREAPPEVEEELYDGTFGDWLDRWWPTKVPELSPSSVAPWRSAIELYLKPHLGDLQIHAVRLGDLEDMYRALVAGGLPASRVQRIHAIASVALGEAVRRRSRDVGRRL